VTALTLREYEDAELAAATDEGRRGLRIHALVTVLVSAVLIAVNVVWAPQFPWSPFAILGMSIGVLMHYLFGVRWVEQLTRKHQLRIEQQAAESKAA
jgi:hypothetical protein